MKLIAAVGDMKVGHKGDKIITYALGSCLGLVVHDPEAKVGGILHAMLPLSKINREKAKSNPFMFVDTGVQEMIRTLYEMGGAKSRFVVKAVGCASPLGKEEMFKIGERNHIILQKLLWKNNILIDNEAIGGSNSRSIFFNVSTGVTIIKCRGQEIEL